ncbi:DUF4244 domain-containing protein [Cellulomonas sp. SG140]|uniref:DUF4244 domain-containing protein n=1 Tax=Cellulomonas sp. SG140 TaxID=2976536 RepID=UPI0021E72853|nr:DUF4244 domain-containing protein [Cellulomonas sp. SG140]
MGADVIGAGVADAGASGADVTSAGAARAGTTSGEPVRADVANVGPVRAGTTSSGAEGPLGVGPLRGFARWVVARLWALRAGARDAGMATAEYAIATLAAVGFAGLLVAILRSDEVRGLLLGIVRRALSS